MDEYGRPKRKKGDKNLVFPFDRKLEQPPKPIVLPPGVPREEPQQSS